MSHHPVVVPPAHLLSDVQLPRHAVVREIRVDRRLQQLGRLSVFVLLRRRSQYSRLRTNAVEFRSFLGLVRRRFAVVVVVVVIVIVRRRIPVHVLIVFAGHRLYRSRRRLSCVVLFPLTKTIKKRKRRVHSKFVRQRIRHVETTHSHVLIVKAVRPGRSDRRWRQTPSGTAVDAVRSPYRRGVRNVFFDRAVRVHAVHAAPSSGCGHSDNNLTNVPRRKRRQGWKGERGNNTTHRAAVATTAACPCPVCPPAASACCSWLAAWACSSTTADCDWPSPFPTCASSRC